jgi:general secretion pathway protein H
MSRAGSEEMRVSGRSRSQRGEAGFTLLELLAVVAIIAVVTGAFMLRPGSGRPAAELAAISGAVASVLRSARAEAMAAGGERVVLLDTAARRVAVEGGRRAVAIAPDIALTATGAASEQRGAGQVSVRFFANGSSTGGALKLQRGQHVHEVRINWLSGRVEIVLP